jgi:hypothetical protein
VSDAKRTTNDMASVTADRVQLATAKYKTS